MSTASADFALSRLVFLEPSQRATSAEELESIVAQRQAFNIIFTAHLEVRWGTESELLGTTDADLSIIYVLHSFVDDVFAHMKRLKCRVIGPLVILQSHAHKLCFPMRTLPTWAQSLNGQIVTGLSFKKAHLNEICDRVVQLGGSYQCVFGPKTNILIVGIFNPENAEFKEAVRQLNTHILKIEWLDAVYESASRFDQEFTRFFTADFQRKFQVEEAMTLRKATQCFDKNTQDDEDHLAVADEQSDSDTPVTELITSQALQLSPIALSSRQVKEELVQERPSKVSYNATCQPTPSRLIDSGNKRLSSLINGTERRSARLINFEHCSTTTSENATSATQETRSSHVLEITEQARRDHHNTAFSEVLTDNNNMLVPYSSANDTEPCSPIEPTTCSRNMTNQHTYRQRSTSQLHISTLQSQPSTTSSRVELEVAIRINKNVLLQKKYYVKKKYLT